MTETDLSTWLTIAEAATALRCSDRTVERLAAGKKLEQRLRPQRGSPDVAVFSPQSVAEEAQRRHPTPTAFVVGSVPPGNGNGHGLTHPNRADGRDLDKLTAGDDPIRQLFAAALRAVLSPPSPPVSVSVSETLYLTVDQAAAYLNWTPRDLRRAIRDGDVPCRFGERRDWRRWRIRRKDLEAL